MADPKRKWIIYWDAGYGKSYEIVEDCPKDEAVTAAYDEWLQEAESSADYGAEPYTEDRATELDLE